jgi:hypothetical protein
MNEYLRNSSVLSAFSNSHDNNVAYSTWSNKSGTSRHNYNPFIAINLALYNPFSSISQLIQQLPKRQEDIYFKKLICYIHLNPLKARMFSDIKELNKCPYSGLSVLMVNKKHEWQDTTYVLSYFGRKDSRKNYFSYVKKVIDQGSTGTCRRRDGAQSWWMVCDKETTFKGIGSG